jgi:hypothetical protein
LENIFPHALILKIQFPRFLFPIVYQIKDKTRRYTPDRTSMDLPRRKGWELIIQTGPDPECCRK